MNNFESFISDYYEYKTKDFTVKEKAKGLATIITAATGTVVGAWGIVQLGLWIASLGLAVVPGLNALTLPLGFAMTPVMIKHGLKLLATNNAWGEMDKSTRINIIAAICFLQKFFTLDFSDLK